LRKEFIVDEYQILRQAHGADLILIAAVLTREEIKTLSQFAKN
jgi:indole-3-glycerol phosphate synthase